MAEPALDLERVEYRYPGATDLAIDDGFRVPEAALKTMVELAQAEAWRA